MKITSKEFDFYYYWDCPEKRKQLENLLLSGCITEGVKADFGDDEATITSVETKYNKIYINLFVNEHYEGYMSYKVSKIAMMQYKFLKGQNII